MSGLAAGGLQAAAQIQEGRIAKAQGSFANKIALRNQESLNRQAEAEKSASRLQEKRIARKQKIVQGRQLAKIGKGGAGLIDATLSALIDTATQFSIERNLALRRGVFMAGALRERGAIIAAQGRWAKTLGKQAARLSYVKAGASLLAGAAISQSPATTSTAGGQGGGLAFGGRGPAPPPSSRTSFGGL
ncbi:hypothetical protein LCGC14_1020680 [marine sediment metagenome]|uniref:Uncharacterized protein n=1 Tax=marine sediment metagenome TaxID=412755 RepID=A0A0F9MXK2_9ZZZZ